MTITPKTVIWAETGLSEKPNDVKIADGWIGVPPEQPFFEWMNWIFKSDEENINALIDQSNGYFNELTYLISTTGGTPDLTPTGPGNQVYEAIFNSQHMDTAGLADSAITTAKINNDAVTDLKMGDDISLEHFDHGNLDIQDGPGNSQQVFLNTSLLKLQTFTDSSNLHETSLIRESGLFVGELVSGNFSEKTTVKEDGLLVDQDTISNIYRYGQVTKYGFEAHYENTSNPNEIETSVSPLGIRFKGNDEPGTPLTLRQSVFSLQGTVLDDNQGTWVSDSTTIGRRLYSSSPSVYWDSEIPDGCQIVSVTFHGYTTITAKPFAAPAFVQWDSQPGNTWGTNEIRILTGDAIEIDVSTYEPIIVVTYLADNFYV